MSIHDVLVAEIPRHEYTQPNIQPGQKWRIEFNAACWLRVRSAQAVIVQLMLRWRDGTGVRQVLVDQTGCSGKDSMLLNGLVSLSATGRVEAMSAWLISDAPCDLFVDELLVQRKLPPQLVAPVQPVARVSNRMQAR